MRAPILFRAVTLFVALFAVPISGRSDVNDDLSQAYTDAFSHEDAAAVGALYLENATYRTTGGAVLSGRAAIEKSLTEFFAANDGASLSIHSEGTFPVTEDVVTTRGVATVTIPGSAPAVTSFTSVLQRKDGKWLIAQVIEDQQATGESPSSTDHLEPLSFLIGKWTEVDGDTKVETTVDWSRGGKFLSRKFTVKRGDGSGVEGLELIGWDARKQQIRSWFFDSDGSFGEGNWRLSGDQWLVLTSSTLPDGTAGSAEQCWKKVNDSTVEWSSGSRVIDGEVQPSLGPIQITRSSK